MASHVPSAYVVPAADAPDDNASDDKGQPPAPVSTASTATKLHDMSPSADCHASIGMGKPPALTTLSWSNISYTITKGSAGKGDRTKTILKRVTGRCGAGELAAVMGPSGCGKTTLLDILADRVSTGRIDGEIELNGAKRDPKIFRSVARYVAQEDSLQGCFTVKETLHMAAHLTLPREATSRDDAASRVDSVLQEMGLHVCENTYVGDVFRKGISGGQKRRLSIAIELLSNPSILLGRTVLCTIHQPSSLVYDMFTNVAILAKGEAVYFGPRVSVISHFTSAGYPCPAYSNPTEFYIGVVNANFEGHGDIPQILSAYGASAIAADVKRAIEDDRGKLRKPRGRGEAETVSAWQQLTLLLYRNSIKNVRNPGIYAVRLVMYVALAVCVGTMYLKTNDRLTDNDFVVLLFGIHAFFVFNSVAVVPFFIQERAVFLRERGNSGLHVGSFVVANFLAGLPGIFSIALSSSIIVVALSGLRSFGMYLLNMFLSLVAAESLMHVLGAVANDGIIGIAMGASLFGMFMVCEGFMVPRHAIPGYWRWVNYIGFPSYGFQAFIHTEFLAGEPRPLPPAVGRLGVSGVSYAENMIILVAYTLGFELVFAAILYKFHTGRR